MQMKMYSTGENKDIDFSERRVKVYTYIARTCIIIDLIRIVCAGVFSKTQQKSKFVKYTLSQ